MVADGNPNFPDKQTSGVLGISRNRTNYLKGGDNGLQLAWINVNINASRSSDRYGNYTEVNPLYTSTIFILKY